MADYRPPPPVRSKVRLLPSIRSIPFDSGSGVIRLTARDRANLANISSVMRVPAGTVFYTRGTDARWVYNISSGTVCSYRERPDGTHNVQAFLFAEDLFGLARRGLYTNSVKAVSPVTVFRIPMDSLSALLMRDAALQFRFLCKATNSVRETQRRAIILTCRDPVQRAAMFLTFVDEAQSERQGADDSIALPMSRKDIASFLNMTAGSVDAAITAIERQGVIAVDEGGDSIRVINRRKFKALVADD